MSQHRRAGEVMASSSLWRIVPAAVIALPALFSLSEPNTAQAKQAKTECPVATQTAAPPPAQLIVSASAVPIWKTITIGELTGVNAVRAAIDAAPCPISIGDWADEILGRPAFP